MTLAITRETLATTVLRALGITATGVHVDIHDETFPGRCEITHHGHHQPHAAIEIRYTTREDGYQHDWACGVCATDHTIADHITALDIAGDLEPGSLIELRISAWYLRYAHGLDI